LPVLKTVSGAPETRSYMTYCWTHLDRVSVPLVYRLSLFVVLLFSFQRPTCFPYCQASNYFSVGQVLLSVAQEVKVSTLPALLRQEIFSKKFLVLRLSFSLQGRLVYRLLQSPSTRVFRDFEEVSTASSGLVSLQGVVVYLLLHVASTKKAARNKHSKRLSNRTLVDRSEPSPHNRRGHSYD
jgi:hypothetical protein